MKPIILGKVFACFFLILIILITTQYLSINWRLMTDWYKVILTTSSFIIISGLIGLAIGNKEISRSLFVAIPIVILILDMIKAGSSRYGLDDSSLIWFKYEESLSYGLKLLWHFGLDLLVFITVLFLKHPPSIFKKFWKETEYEEG